MANKNFRVKHGLEVAGSATIESDLTVTGNLTVNGDTTTLNTATLSVEDNVVVLNSNVTGTPSTNAGIEVERGDSTNTLLQWNESTDKWQFTNDGSTYYDMVTANTTYTQNASTTTGGANLNLVGSDSTTDSIKLSGGTGVTISRLDADTVDIGIGQAVGTGADVVFNSVDANIVDSNYIVGQLYATRNTSYVPPTSALTTITGTNGIVVSSSAGGANGYGAGVGIRYHTGDTTAGGLSAPVVSFSTATGTNGSPTGAVTNLVAGGLNFDGYTAGTSPNYASQIATINQGAGTGAIQPLQAHAYARQNFTNSTTVTTAVTGASGTGSVATLTFTTQNTAPYVVGQTITVAGMTPSGYNGTYVLTAATTSSISYANATTGFTTGGTIGTANTVTAAGMGFRVRGFANSTVLSAANRFNFMDLTASSATFKSNTYTFANEVITGATLTATNYMTLGATTGTINQDTFTLKNTAGTTTYATFASTGHTLSAAGLHTFTRTTTGTPGSSESRPSLNIQLSRTDQATPNNGDSTSFRTRVSGSNGTFYTLSDVNTSYATNGNINWNLTLANGDQTTGSFSGLATITSAITGTTIRAGTASGTAGASTVSDVANFAAANTTIKSDAVALQTNGGAALKGSAISYGRVYGQWQYNTTITPAAADTAYVFPIGTADFASTASVGSTSRIILGAAGMYNLQFSVQVNNADNGNEHVAYIWLKKNGTDIANSTGRITIVKGGGQILGWNFVIDSANTTDYYEIAYAVDSTQLTFPAYSSTAFCPGTATLVTTITPIGA